MNSEFRFASKKFFAFFVLQCCLIFSYAQEKDIAYYISNAPFKMPNVIEPKFPSKNFVITDFGAVSNGQALNTEAFAKAIDACNKAGGGHVIVPAGLWLTGPIEMKSNVDLHLERGALIQFT